jgi:hypothetical protein
MKLISPLVFITVACASLTAARSAHGHETVPQDWCTDRNTTPVIVSKFEWDKETLIEIGQSCGIVDISDGDAWSVANGIVSVYCDTQSPKGYSAVPFIVGPQSYNNKSHHETYRLEDGLAGSCAVCVPRRDRPAGR